MNNCELAFKITNYPFYRTAQYFTSLVSFISIFPLFYLIYKKLWNSTFHRNIKTLLIIYFSEIIVSTLSNFITFIYNVINPFFAKTNCDLNVNPTLFVIIQYVGIFAVSSPMMTIIAISAERTIALIFAKDYESFQGYLGLTFGLITVVLDMYIVRNLFANEKFDKPPVSLFLIPPTSAAGLNTLFWTLLVLNIINFLVDCVLFWVTKVMSKRRKSSLTIRYQMEELLLSTKFTMVISFLHVSFFGIYLCSTLLTRIMGPVYLNSEAEIMAVRGVYVTIPTYNFLIGIVASRTLTNLQMKKISKVDIAVRMKYTGVEGAQNHDAAIKNLWDSQSGDQNRK